jgi:hypothetical protein
MQCRQCTTEISLLIEALYSKPQLCSDCSGEQQETVKGGYRLWMLLPDGTRSQERIWCPGCRSVLCKRGLEHYEQCTSCQRLINDLAELTEWPDGCIEFLDHTMWYPECTQCYQGEISGYNGARLRCSRCREQHEEWLNQHARRDIRYTLQISYQFLELVYFTNERKKGMGKHWVKYTKGMDFLARKEEFAIRYIPEPKNTPVVVRSTAFNRVTGKREQIRIDDRWELAFSSPMEAQEWIYKRMGHTFKNFWL